MELYIYIGPCAKQRSKNGHWRDQECVLNTVRWCVQNEGMNNSAILVGIRMHSTNDYCWTRRAQNRHGKVRLTVLPRSVCVTFLEPNLPNCVSMWACVSDNKGCNRKLSSVVVLASIPRFVIKLIQTAFRLITGERHRHPAKVPSVRSRVSWKYLYEQTKLVIKRCVQT